MAQIALQQDAPLDLDDWSFALPEPPDPRPDPLVPAASCRVDLDLLALQLGYQPAPR